MNVHAMLSPMHDAAACPPSPASSVASSTSSTASSFSLSSTTANETDANTLKRGWVAPFLLHLHQMLRRESAKIIRWTDDGMAFQILDKDAMTAQILPRYFKNKNFASFQRQLNYFGFRKWSKARAQFSTYSREHFTRDNYGDMSLVKRQSKKSRKRPTVSSSAEQQDAKRVPSSHALWVASDKCKPILPRVGAVSSEILSIAASPATSPLLRASPVSAPVSSAPQSWRAPPSMELFVRAPTSMTATLSLPAISPARKVTSSCKLPSLRDLAFSHSLSESVRPCWLA